MKGETMSKEKKEESEGGLESRVFYLEQKVEHITEVLDNLVKRNCLLTEDR